MPRPTSRTAPAADAGAATFPEMALPILPPWPPMEARPVDRLPTGAEWRYEPKWDGFRCLAFRDGAMVVLQSKAGLPLTRYFPEVEQRLMAAPVRRFVLDAELVIVRDGRLSFDDLLLRVHPAASRVRRLAAETPARLIAFDLLVDPRGRDLTSLPLRERQKRLAALVERLAPDAGVERSPSTDDVRQATRWLRDLDALGCDGVMAKLADLPYQAGTRDGMRKVKRMRTADCVVGGFRYASGTRDRVGSLLLGLYDADGRLDHVGFTSGFTASQRAELLAVLRPVMGGEGFSGRSPGGPSRWNGGETSAWEPLTPRLVCEVRYDHVVGGRFRHATAFLRWRPDKPPRACTFAQLR